MTEKEKGEQIEKQNKKERKKPSISANKELYFYLASFNE